MIYGMNKAWMAVIFVLLTISYSSQAYYEFNNATDSEVDCLARTLQGQHTQINIKQSCPKLYDVLWQKQLTGSFEFPLSNQVTQTQLRLLQASVQISGRLRLIDISGLDKLLAEIYTAKPEDKSNAAWEQFITWLNSFKPERYEAEFNWLIELLETLTPSIESARIIMYLVFAVIILLAVGLLFRELYLSGVWFRSKRKDKQAVAQTLNLTEEQLPMLSLAEIKQLGPKIQTTALLKNVIEYLVNHDSLPKNAALTNLELKYYLHQQKSTSAKAFSLLLTDVEPVLYGNSMPSEQALERCWQNAKQIVKS